MEEYTNHVSTLFRPKVENVKQIISIIRTAVDLHYKEQACTAWIWVSSTGRVVLNRCWSFITGTLWQPCFNPAKGSSFKTDERQDMQECLKFHVRFIDLGLFFHVLISPVNIWAERLWTEISLNMNKSACVNVIWICAFHLPKCQRRSEGVITGSRVTRPMLFQINLFPGLRCASTQIHGTGKNVCLFVVCLPLLVGRALRQNYYWFHFYLLRKGIHAKCVSQIQDFWTPSRN